MKQILLCLCLVSAVAMAADTRLSVPYTRFTLPNGLTVILHEDHSTPMVSVNIYYHVGSARENPGRTGFAHLFEHIMYEGSGHVPEGKYDEWLESAGGENNGSTSDDRTNYWITAPKNGLDLALFLESDRMGYLLDAMSPAKVDGQRDVVKNERRQSYENRPYGMSEILIFKNVYPADHPYSWPTIGSMEDLSAARYEDVVEFFKRYYRPGNASLSIAGDINPAQVKAAVEKWFSDVPAGPPVPPQATPAAFLDAEKRLVYEDNVQLPRLYMVWHSPRSYAPGDAELDVAANIMAGGKNSRLYKRLVYELQIAQDVSAYEQSQQLGSLFQVVVTARAGHSLAEIEKVVEQEIDKLKEEAPSAREVARAVNQYEAAFLRSLEAIGGFGGKADKLNNYFVFTGNPDYFQEDLSRYRALDPEDVRAAVSTTLRDDARFILSVVPRGKTDLAAPSRKEAK
jgi:zinc protease